GYSELWAYVLAIFVDQVQEPEGTLGIDTMSLLNKHKRGAYLQERQLVRPEKQTLDQIEYGKPNEAIRDLYQMAAAFRKNVVLTHHLKQVYEPDVKDGKVEHVWKGKYETDGVPDTMKQSDVLVRMEQKETRE